MGEREGGGGGEGLGGGEGEEEEDEEEERGEEEDVIRLGEDGETSSGFFRLALFSPLNL